MATGNVNILTIIIIINTYIALSLELKYDNFISLVQLAIYNIFIHLLLLYRGVNDQFQVRALL